MNRSILTKVQVTTISCRRDGESNPVTLQAYVFDELNKEKSWQNEEKFSLFFKSILNYTQKTMN